MRKLLAAALVFLFALLFVQSFAAEVTVSKDKAAVNLARQARSLLEWVTANGIDPDEAPTALKRAILKAQETLSTVEILPDDPTNQQINDAIALVEAGERYAVFWLESSPSITCADIDNALLVANNLCVTRLSSSVHMVAVVPGETLSMACENGVRGKIRC